MAKHKILSNENKNSLRLLKFGDIDEKSGCLVLGEDEAALIVMDRVLMPLARLDPAINVFVCAVAGSEEDVAAEKRKYENNPRYEIGYFPVNPSLK